MSLDIVISDTKSNTEKLIRLYLDEYDIIVETLRNAKDFEITKRVLANYYGDDEIYLSELEGFKFEVLELKNLLQTNRSMAVKEFIINLLDTINYAILNNRTIKFIGD